MRRKWRMQYGFNAQLLGKEGTRVNEIVRQLFKVFGKGAVSYMTVSNVEKHLFKNSLDLSS